MSYCGVCGEDYLRCNCESQQPYCDQCVEDTKCNYEMDSACVIYHPNPTDPPSGLDNLGMPNGSSAEDIFEAIDDFLANGANVPITIVNTRSINMQSSGTAKHTIAANVTISPDFNNQLEIRDNGVYARPYNENFLVKVDADDFPDYLKNQIVGGTDGIVSISTFVESGQVKVQPSIDIICLLNEIRDNYLEEFCAVVDLCKCFLTVQNFEALLAPGCPDGYTLNDEGTLCIQETEEPAVISEDTVEACVTRSTSWNAYGTLLYNSQFLNDGRGPAGSTTNNLDTDLSSGAVIAINTTNVWQNVAHAGSGTPDDLDGPLNRAGIWSCPEGSNITGTLGFVVPIDVPTTKTYYVGISGDNDVEIIVTPPNGSPTLIIETRHNDVSDYEDYYGDSVPFAGQGAFMPFRAWHIYPVTLQAGVNYVQISGTNNGSDGGYAAEIYNATAAELQAAALKPEFTSDPNNFPNDENPYSNIDLVFSTRCGRTSGTTFSVGSATCDDSTWTLDTSGGQPLVSPCQGINVSPENWVCRKTLTAPFSGYSVTLVWDRLDDANSYTIQYKPASEPDSAFVEVEGSPVANPSSGSTVTLDVDDLPTNQLDFRIRANFATCSTPWAPADNTDLCVGVDIDDSVELPDGIVGSPYSAQIPILAGSPPITITNIVAPSWMDLAVDVSAVFITGTPDVATSGTTVSFTLNNCSGITANYSDTIVVTEESTVPNPLVATVSMLCVNPNGGDSGCASQSIYQLQFDLPAALPSPVTLKVAAIDVYNSGTYRYRYGRQLIPSVPTNADNIGAYFPAEITIPAGVTQYITRTSGNPNITNYTYTTETGGFTVTHTCFNLCNPISNPNRVKELHFQPQAPNASLVLDFTRGSTPDTPANLVFFQVP
jgi:hypothetical protein